MNAILSPTHPSTVTSCKRELALDLGCAGLGPGFGCTQPHSPGQAGQTGEGRAGRAGPSHASASLVLPPSKSHVRYCNSPSNLEAPSLHETGQENLIQS